ncbi:MAG: hypothetical protein Ct9H300mP11_07140 [Chloroflexota bacterium]|nr:MAG: hypothetical protein Ct9H300mP11_07140 [Chloroflexota bacterium]
MRVLIFGCDRLSANLVEDISRRDNQVTVLGDDRDCLERISSSLGVSSRPNVRTNDARLSTGR